MSKIDAAVYAASLTGGTGGLATVAHDGTLTGDGESRVSALAAAVPSDVTGLSAMQLDTQYSDDYNIVRIGTPTRSIESEESHHE